MNTQHSKAGSLSELDAEELALVHGGAVLEKIAPTEQRVWVTITDLWHERDVLYGGKWDEIPGEF